MSGGSVSSSQPLRPFDVFSIVDAYPIADCFIPRNSFEIEIDSGEMEPEDYRKAVREANRQRRETVSKTKELANNLLISGLNRIFVSYVQRDDVNNVRRHVSHPLISITHEVAQFENCDVSEGSTKANKFSIDIDSEEADDELSNGDDFEEAGYILPDAVNSQYDKQPTTAIQSALFFQAESSLKVLIKAAPLATFRKVLVDSMSSFQPLSFLCGLTGHNVPLINSVLEMPRIQKISEKFLAKHPEVKTYLEALKKKVAGAATNATAASVSSDDESEIDYEKERQRSANYFFQQGLREIFWANLITGNVKATEALLRMQPSLLKTRVQYYFEQAVFKSSVALTAAAFHDRQMFQLLLDQPNRLDLVAAFNVEDDASVSSNVTRVPAFVSFYSLNITCRSNPPNLKLINLFLKRLREATCDFQRIESWAIKSMMFAHPITNQTQVDALTAITESSIQHRRAIFLKSSDLSNYLIPDLVNCIASYAFSCDNHPISNKLLIQYNLRQDNTTNLELFEKAIAILKTPLSKPIDTIKPLRISTVFELFFADINQFLTRRDVTKLADIPTNIQYGLTEIAAQLAKRFNRIPENEWDREAALKFLKYFVDNKDKLKLQFLIELPSIRHIINLLAAKYNYQSADNSTAAGPAASSSSGSGGSAGSGGAAAELEESAKTESSAKVRASGKQKREIIDIDSDDDEGNASGSTISRPMDTTDPEGKPSPSKKPKTHE